MPPSFRCLISTLCGWCHWLLKWQHWEKGIGGRDWVQFCAVTSLKHLWGIHSHRCSKEEWTRGGIGKLSLNRQCMIESKKKLWGTSWIYLICKSTLRSNCQKREGRPGEFHKSGTQRSRAQCFQEEGPLSQGRILLQSSHGKEQHVGQRVMEPVEWWARSQLGIGEEMGTMPCC